MTAGSGGAASRCRPLGSRETYGRSSPGDAMATLSRSSSTRDSGARARSGARSARVPKSGFRSTASARSRRWLARTLPVRKVLVVLPQPPFGESVATMFGPEATVSEIDGAHYWSHLERPAAVAAEIDRFLASTTAVARLMVVTATRRAFLPLAGGARPDAM